MELKLGELLIKEKIITQEQLDEVLDNNVFYGVRLGSSLVEMGYVEEDRLAKVLSEKFGVPYVGAKELFDVPSDVIQDFSRALIVKYQVVPFKLERNRLGLAMTNPNDFKAIEEISFITGHVVQPYIAPDVQISKARAKYYRISEGEMRYQQFACQNGTGRKQRADQTDTVTVSAYSEDGQRLNVIIPAEFETFASLNREMEFEYEPSRITQPVKRYSADEMFNDFVAARSREVVADAFIRYLSQEFERAALFILRGTTAVGWRCVKNGAVDASISRLSFLLSKPSVLQDAVDYKSCYLERLMSSAENRQILAAMGIAEDAKILVAPVVMLGKVVVVTLVSGEEERLNKKMEELQALAMKVSLALEMLIIKRNVLMS